MDKHLRRAVARRKQRSSSKRQRSNAAHRKYIATHIKGEKHKYCTGCGKLFARMHDMLNHRRSHRCGGKWMMLNVLWPEKWWRIRDERPNLKGEDKLRKPKHKARIPGQPKHIDIFDWSQPEGFRFICNSRNKYRYKQWRRSARI